MSDTLYTGTISNTCQCDEDEGCQGECWEWLVEDFTEVTKDFRDTNETDWWQVKNLRLWNGEVSGYFQAKTVLDILRGMAVDSAWTMDYTVHADRIEYSLAHHDAPMGSSSVLMAVSDDERERLGLY